MKICVYGAASPDIRQTYLDAMYALSEYLAKRGHDLVFGAGDSGVMGAAARGFHAGGGKVIGVAPGFFKVDGILYQHCDTFIESDDMADRKQFMESQADAFLVGSGGIGTLDEFFQAYTLKQLGQMNKPLVLYNVAGCFDPIVQLLRSLVDERFMPAEALNLYHAATDMRETADYIENYKATNYSILDVRSIKQEDS